MYVDPAARTIRAQGGVTWAELNRETAVHGLAVTGGAISTTGIAGLTLGGGLGWLMGIHEARRRQPALGRAGDGRRGSTEHHRAVRSRPLLGAAWRGRKLRRRNIFRVPAPSPEHGRRRPHRAPVRSRQGRPSLLSRLHAVRGPGRADGVRRARARARRSHAEARRDRRVSRRLGRASGAGHRPAARFRRTAVGGDRTDAVPDHEHPPRRRLRKGQPELLEVELRRGNHGPDDRHDDRALRFDSVAVERSALRALPRRSDQDRRDRHGRSSQGRGIPPP